jgi:hypothetical protein
MTDKKDVRNKSRHANADRVHEENEKDPRVRFLVLIQFGDKSYSPRVG